MRRPSERLQMRLIRDRADARVRVAYFVAPSKQFAGIESVTHEIAQGLSARHGDVLDVHVVFCTDYGDAVLGAAYTKHVLGVERLFRVSRRLRAWAQACDVDVFVVPQVEATVLTWLATRGLRIPVFVSHLHGSPAIEERDGSRRTRAAFQVYRRVLARRLSTVWTVSPSLAAHVSRYLSDRAPVHYVPNPARLLGSTVDWVPGTGEEWRLVSVGRLSHQKGHDLLLEALALARANLPLVRLTLVGGGPDEQSLRDRCTRLGLDDVVDFVGYTDPSEHLRRADCFVFPSRWEGFGMVLVEALQFGVPLLAADCDFGPADVITDARIGKLVPPDDASALARGLLEMSGRPRFEEHVEARVQAAGAFRPEHAVAAHLTALRRAVALDTSASHRLSLFASDRGPA